MKKLHKIAFATVTAMFALSISPVMDNSNSNIAQAAVKQSIHHKKGTKKARYAKIRKRGNVYVTTKSGGYYYKDAALKHHAKKRGYKAGKTLRVKKIVLYHGLKRFKLANGSYITAYHAHFNYHFTYKKAAKKLLKKETIIKARKNKKVKRTKKAKKSKKVNKAKKAKKNSKKKVTKKQKNSNAKILMQGKITESTKAPTDLNADPYAGMHKEGDVWYQEANGNTNVVATFKFTNGKWQKIDNATNKDVKKQDNSKNATILSNGALIQSTNAPTDLNADPYAGKHKNGDIWQQQSPDKKSTIAVFVYSNNGWTKKQSNDANNEAKKEAEKNAKITRAYQTSTVAPTDPSANDKFAGQHQDGDKWEQLSVTSNISTIWIFSNGKWSVDKTIKGNNSDDTTTYKNAYASAIKNSQNETLTINPSDPIPNQLGTFAAIEQLTNNNGNADDNNAPQPVDFKKHTVTINNKEVTLDATKSYTAPMVDYKNAYSDTVTHGKYTKKSISSDDSDAKQLGELAAIEQLTLNKDNLNNVDNNAPQNVDFKKNTVTIGTTTYSLSANSKDTFDPDAPTGDSNDNTFADDYITDLGTGLESGLSIDSSATSVEKLAQFAAIKELILNGENADQDAPQHDFSKNTVTIGNQTYPYDSSAKYIPINN